ncbi:MAG: thioredoxin [Clostridia bacterium]
MNNILHLSGENFDTAINGAKPVLVDFWAQWCGPCKMLAPVLEEVSSEVSELVFAKLDIDESEDIAVRYGVMSIPTLVIFKNGNVVAKTVGYKNKTQILSFIQDNI